MPARFLIACPAGHLDDFPWEEYVHGGSACVGGPILERIELAPEPDRDPNVLGQGADGLAPLAGGALVQG
jgi:hypothetical protein